MNPNLNEINPEKVGKSVENTTNFLKKLSDYIEKKLYDSEGNVKNSGVKSISLTFAMLVGFAMAIVVLSSFFIGFILFNKSNVIEAKDKEISLLKIEVNAEDTESKYWEKRYNNVYSQCDSIGFVRARQALEFSNTLKNELNLEKNKINNSVKQNSDELKELNKYNKDIKSLQSKIK